MLITACSNCSGMLLEISHNSGHSHQMYTIWQASTDCCMLPARSAAQEANPRE